MFVKLISRITVCIMVCFLLSAYTLTASYAADDTGKHKGTVGDQRNYYVEGMLQLVAQFDLNAKGLTLCPHKTCGPGKKEGEIYREDLVPEQEGQAQIFDNIPKLRTAIINLRRQIKFLTATDITPEKRDKHRLRAGIILEEIDDLNAQIHLNTKEVAGCPHLTCEITPVPGNPYAIGGDNIDEAWEAQGELFRDQKRLFIKIEALDGLEGIMHQNTTPWKTEVDIAAEKAEEAIE